MIDIKKILEDRDWVNTKTYREDYYTYQYTEDNDGFYELTFEDGEYELEYFIKQENGTYNNKTLYKGDSFFVCTGKIYDFLIPDVEIENWLLSREWLHYYTRSRVYSGIFTPVPKSDTCSKTKDGYPYYDSGNSSVSLDLPWNMTASYGQPSIMLKIWGDNTVEYNLDKYELEIYGILTRCGDTDFEQLFHGWVSNLDEIKQVFRLLSVNEKYLI